MRALDLEPWVAIVEAALPAHQNAMLVRLVPDGDTIELGLLPLDGVHPAELLDGFDAPEEWAAIGLVARGRSLTAERKGRVVITHLVGRDGAEHGRVVDNKGEVLIDSPAPVGELPRLLRQALALS